MVEGQEETTPVDEDRTQPQSPRCPGPPYPLEVSYTSPLELKHVHCPEVGSQMPRLLQGADSFVPTTLT